LNAGPAARVERPGEQVAHHVLTAGVASAG
jgi:hypothetical protein